MTLQIALKYGLLIAGGVAAWVLIAHTLVPNPCAPIHVVGAPAFFNFLEIALIYVGMGARKRENGGELQFKAGLKTGLAIAFVYGIGASLFFLAFLTLTGAQVMCAEAGVASRPSWQVALVNFLGLFLGAIFLGLIYSTVVAFVLATRRKKS